MISLHDLESRLSQRQCHMYRSLHDGSWLRPLFSEVRLCLTHRAESLQAVFTAGQNYIQGSKASELAHEQKYQEQYKQAAKRTDLSC